MLEHAIIILIIFAATTILYLTLYRKISCELPEPLTPSRGHPDADEESANLRGMLPDEHAELKRLLEELREIRRRAEALLDERGCSEGEGGGDKRGPEGD